MKDWTITVKITDELAHGLAKLGTSEKVAVQQRLKDDARIILLETITGSK